MSLTDLQTELGAVNAMLRSISTSPVDRLEGDDVSTDATNALNTLRETSRAFQGSHEWFFNSEKIRLQPTMPDGTVPLPLNTLSFIADDKRFVERSGRIYDRHANTFQIGAPVCGTLRVLLNFEDLPNAAREYVGVKAKRIFQGDEQGDGATIRRPDEDELRAYAAILNEDAEAQQYSILNSPAVNRITLRYGPPYGGYGG